MIAPASEQPSIAYKILTADQWNHLVSTGVFKAAPIDLVDGYIHLSAADQVDETASKHFAGQTDLHIAAVDLGVLASAVRWEPSRGGALFPHIYADLPLSAVIAHRPLIQGADGKVSLPVSG